MDKDKILNDIKEGLKSLFTLNSNNEVSTPEVETEIKLWSMETVDGFVLESDDEMLVIGSEVFKIENEERMPLEDGIYETTAGLNLEVASGKIVTIKEVQVEDVIENPIENPEAMVEMEVENPAVEELKSKVENLEKVVATLSKLVTDLSNGNVEMVNKISELSAQPSEAPIIFDKQLSTVDLRVERLDKLKNLVKR